MDEYLAKIYPNYFESTRAVLLRQARDLFETEFHADLSWFEREFLSPAAELIKIIKNSSHNLSVSVFGIQKVEFELFFFCFVFAQGNETRLLSSNPILIGFYHPIELFGEKSNRTNCIRKNDLTSKEILQENQPIMNAP